MPRLRFYKDKNVKKVGGGQYSIFLPKEVILESKWKKGQMIVCKYDEREDEIRLKKVKEE